MCSHTVNLTSWTWSTEWAKTVQRLMLVEFWVDCCCEQLWFDLSLSTGPLLGMLRNWAPILTMASLLLELYVVRFVNEDARVCSGSLQTCIVPHLRHGRMGPERCCTSVTAGAVNIVVANTLFKLYSREAVERQPNASVRGNDDWYRSPSSPESLELPNWLGAIPVVCSLLLLLS